MIYLSIKEIFKKDKELKDIIVRGWVKTVRNLKDIYFIELNDGSIINNLQIVCDKEVENYDSLKNLSTGSSVEFIGDISLSPAKEQKWEMKGKKVKIFSIADPENYPLQKKRHSFEFLRTITHLKPRTNTFGAIIRVRSHLAYAIHKFFYERDFYYIHTPIITGSDCEGAGAMFQVTTLDYEKLLKEKREIDWKEDFFGKKTFLTVSGQLEAEIYACSLGKVYTFGPTFRAENSNTTRHLAEFWMIEPEMAFYELEDNIKLAEEFIKYIIKYVIENDKEDMEFFDKWVANGLLKKLEDVINSSFEVVEYSQGIKILENSGEKFEFPVHFGVDLQSEHERYLTEKYFKKPIFLINYPKEIKAFYMKQNDDGKTVRAMDLLVPQIGEIIGGSQREDDYDKLLEAIRRFGLNESDYWWYLDLRKYGSVPHSGFGLGFERLIQFVTGMSNIRDVIPIYRVPGFAEF
ncbi:MAG: asparagine--tRNA ligase [Spirochaetes bacterium]|nr:asparagine--tRNA ligase [Spirochaetota bacterium]